jgi:hypothetical protein
VAGLSAARTARFRLESHPRAEQNFVGSPIEVAELCDVIQIFVADDEALLGMVQQLSPV